MNSSVARPSLLGSISALCGCLTLCPSAIAQSYFDISSCFNQLLQQQTNYTSTEQFKHDATLSAVYDFIPLSANYSDFNEKRRNYFSLHKLDLDYYRAISTSSR